MKRYEKRKEAKYYFGKLMEEKSSVLFIHYSCESFYDREDHGSHRITTIAVRHYQSAQTQSFSISKYAEIKKISYNKIEENYDLLEKQMLKEFYEYVGKHENSKWIHWNMRDENYGFPAIALRYKVLGGKPVTIHESNLFDLGRLTVNLYSEHYIGHQRLEQIIIYNKISHKDFLNGAEEARAFENKEFIKLHQSTLRKVDNLENIFEKILSNTLKHKAKFSHIYGGIFTGWINYIKEHPLWFIVTFIGTVFGIVGYFFPPTGD
jgi:hypothetical protein